MPNVTTKTINKTLAESDAATSKKTIMTLFKWLFALRKSRFLKNMSIVMSGTAIAQLIGFALTPVISRLFTSEDFGLFGAFNSIVMVVTAGVTLQYSQALMLPKKDEDATNVLAIALISVLAFVLVSGLFVYTFPEWIFKILNSSRSRWILLFLPLAIGITGINISFQAWCVRRKEFKKTAYSQAIRTASNGSIQIFTGLLHFGGLGLILSSILANLTASINLIRQVAYKDRHLFQEGVTGRDVRRLAVEFRDFPIFAMPQNVINALSQGLPVLLLAHFYGIAVAGAYAFGMRIIKVPMTFFSTALRQVLFQKASETYNNNGNLVSLYLKLTGGLFIITLIPTLVTCLWAPKLFNFAFGEEWYAAGLYARWLILWVAMAFCNIPSILFARILRKQKSLLIFEIFQLIFRLGILLACGFYVVDPHKAIAILSIFGMSSNMTLIVLIGVIMCGTSNSKLSPNCSRG